jgi:hypothetical protein
VEIKAPMGVITSNNNNSFSTREEVEHVICKYIVSNRLMCRGVYGARSKISAVCCVESISIADFFPPI